MVSHVIFMRQEIHRWLPTVEHRLADFHAWNTLFSAGSLASDWRLVTALLQWRWSNFWLVLCVH